LGLEWKYLDDAAPMETAPDLLRKNLERGLPADFLCLKFADGK